MTTYNAGLNNNNAGLDRIVVEDVLLDSSWDVFIDPPEFARSHPGWLVFGAEIWFSVSNKFSISNNTPMSSAKYAKILQRFSVSGGPRALLDRVCLQESYVAAGVVPVGYHFGSGSMFDSPALIGLFAFKPSMFRANHPVVNVDIVNYSASLNDSASFVKDVIVTTIPFDSSSFHIADPCVDKFCPSWMPSAVTFDDDVKHRWLHEMLAGTELEVFAFDNPVLFCPYSSPVFIAAAARKMNVSKNGLKRIAQRLLMNVPELSSAQNQLRVLAASLISTVSLEIFEDCLYTIYDIDPEIVYGVESV